MRIARSMQRILPVLLTLSAACAGPGACGGSKSGSSRSEPSTDSAPELEALGARLAQFTPAELTAPIEDLPASEKKALDLLIQASRELDPIFDRQAYRKNPDLEAKLSQDDSPLGQLKLAYFRIHRGPWDRQDHHAPFAIETARPKGAGFYPEDLTAQEFEAYLAAHPEQAESLQSLHTLVEREGDRLVAIPYREAFAEWLGPAAAKLREAADATEDPTLQRFLRSRAKAFETDEYYASDKDWMDLKSRVEVTIGPYETYEDQLLGLKASYESFVTVTDPAASRRLAKYKALLPAMEQNLPVPDEVKTERGRHSPIRVVDLVFSSGDARKSVQTIAFNLPNDERVRKEKGAKKVLLRNLIETKFEQILAPIAERIMTPDQAQVLAARAFFTQVLFHELSHSLGPAFTKVDGAQKEVRLALGPTYSPLEECKADVMGAYNVLYMVDRGEMPPEFRRPFLLSYFAGLFRSVRFGVAEAHGKGAAVQINRYLEEKAATFEEDRFTVDLEQLERSIQALTRDLVLLQHAGDRKGAEALLAKYGVSTPPMEAALSQLEGVPVDIRPIYPLAGERL